MAFLQKMISNERMSTFEYKFREEKQAYLHQVLASGSSIAGSTLRKVTLRMKP